MDLLDYMKKNSEIILGKKEVYTKGKVYKAVCTDGIYNVKNNGVFIRSVKAESYEMELQEQDKIKRDGIYRGTEKVQGFKVKLVNLDDDDYIDVQKEDGEINFKKVQGSAVEESKGIEGYESISLATPKLPQEHYLKVTKWFEDVYDKNGTESSMLIYYGKLDESKIPSEYKERWEQGKVVNESTKEEEGWVLYIPTQENTSVVTKFLDKLADHLKEEQELSLVCEAHSHHVMNAFWSGTDLANQKEFKHYLVIGQIKGEEKQYALKYALDELENGYQALSLEELVETDDRLKVIGNKYKYEMGTESGWEIEEKHYKQIYRSNPMYELENLTEELIELQEELGEEFNKDKELERVRQRLMNYKELSEEIINKELARVRKELEGFEGSEIFKNKEVKGKGGIKGIRYLFGI